MPKTKISEFSATPGNNTDIDGINIAEGCAPSGINDAIRELMSQLKDFQAGTAGDSFNGPVGTTTAAAGAFTTLSASGAVTLSGGTANGVPYLNGSKVLTTGSALTFDGDTFGVSGTATLAGSFNSTSANGTAIRLQNSSANKLLIGSVKYITGGSASEYGIGASGDNPIVFATNDVERMRLTSTGLGIGTSSPTAIVHASKSTASDTYFRATNSLVSSVFGTSASGETYVYNNGAYPIRFFTNDTERMRLDSVGNLGLGVTPPSTFSGYTALNLSATSIYNYSVGGNRQTHIYNNGFINSSGSAAYINSDPASRIYMTNGTIQFGVAGSGTAGNAISFTQAMTLDASGNLGVGTTSPNPISWGRSLTLNTTSNGAYDLAVNGSEMGYFYANSSLVGVGSYANVPLAFYTNNTERARITSGGYFKASNSGTYVGSTGAYHEMYQSTGTGTICYFGNNSTTPVGIQVTYLNAAPNGTGNEFLYCSDTGAQRATIRSNGGIANYSGNNVNLSDRREKTNFAPAGEYLSKICAIPVQTFNYIDQNMEEDAGLTLGVVAQDVQAVAPELVMESNWAKEGEEPKMRLSIYQTDLQYALMKCIQEQQAIINQLTARIEALEQA